MGADWEKTVRTVVTGAETWRVREVKPKPGRVEPHYHVLIFECGERRRWTTAPMYMIPHWTDDDLRILLRQAKPFSPKDP